MVVTAELGLCQTQDGGEEQEARTLSWLPLHLFETFCGSQSSGFVQTDAAAPGR
jgi:hypothetical protein